MEEDLKEISENSWFAWSKHVLLQLEMDTKCLHEIKKDVSELKVQVAGLKKDIYYRAGLVGVLAGALPAAVAITVYYITKVKP